MIVAPSCGSGALSLQPPLGERFRPGLKMPEESWACSQRVCSLLRFCLTERETRDVTISPLRSLLPLPSFRRLLSLKAEVFPEEIFSFLLPSHNEIALRPGKPFLRSAWGSSTRGHDRVLFPRPAPV